MRVSIIVLSVVLGVLAAGSASAKPSSKKRVALSEEKRDEHRIDRAKPKSRAQSVGAPWNGTLRNPSRFKSGTGYFIRRSQRVYATRTTIAHTKRAIAETRADFPKIHTLAIGDFSEEDGGKISGHHSHRSGRDVDLGLFYKKTPRGYPENFVAATEDNLDKVAMWRLIAALASTSDDDGGVQIMFLDFQVQGWLYKWAKANGVPEKRLDKLFQYPHGRGAAEGLIRHEPNHNDHIHVRYRCAAADTSCR